MDELEIADVLEFPEPRRRWVRRGVRGLVGEPAVCEDRVDDVGLGRLDDADDFHRGTARGTFKRIDLPDTLDEGGPPAAGSAGRGGPGGLLLVRPVAVGLGAQAAILIRVEAEVSYEILAGVRDVLGELGDEVQCVEDLEVAGDPLD